MLSQERFNTMTDYPVASHVPELLAEIVPLESMRSRLCAALGLPADSEPETVAEAVEARRVVPDSAHALMVSHGSDGTLLVLWEGSGRDFKEKFRAIPADRVLGEGERKVGAEEWMYLSALERYARKHAPESIQDVVWCLDHLRANQGGAEHGNG